MAKLLHGQLIRRIFRVIAVLIILVAGTLFASAIIIFQKPENRLWGGDTAPSGEPDAFPLVIIGFCIFWNSLVLFADVARKTPIRPKKAQLPDAVLWMSLIASASTTIYLSKPFEDFSSPDFNKARKIEGWGIVMTYAASVLQFIVFCFTLRDAIVAKCEKNAKKTADMEAANQVKHAECQKCKNVELPPAYEHVEVEETFPIEQAMMSKTEQGPIAGTLPLQPSQSGLSAIDDEGRVLGA